MGSYESTMLKLEQMASQNTAKQMDWQEKMSKTSHQMEVADLVKAGLNPVLSSNQGANAYTTSVDSAVNGIASMASAREGANATKFAARQAAAATRAAAASQLAAARESAAAARYAADQHLEATKFQTLNSKSGSAFGILENAVRGSNNGFTLSDFKGISKSTKDIINNPSKYFVNVDKGATYNNMNWRGRQFIQNALRKIGISVTLPNQNVAFNALILGNKNAMSTYSSWVKSYNKRANSAVSKSYRTGSGVW